MRHFIGLALALVLLGCGYHFPGQGGTLPAGVEKLYIPLFVNKTAEPQLENRLTASVSEVLSRNKSLVQVGRPDQADALLLGTLDRYQRRALSFDKNDDITEYRATLVASLQLKKARTEDLLWQKTLSWSADYRAAADRTAQRDLENQAIDEISLRLAEELLNALLDDF
ncbi:MAG: LPS assembly lipoprotein LptE [Deltaproteobacteria bacterium]|jgi:outer membrane lipopolysaccharide assembly protein LptE/RlpB|nr:LPS assembly lipoprotein LptE [Deltaproteobacteria bacterium]MCW9049540.1 LPS assembly lipoprotein LptE [Deltaproteobacteria bacterium]